MQRCEGWEARLDAEFAATRKSAHVWGEFDCILWPANVVRALLRYDPAAAWRGRYSDAVGAYRLMRDYIGRELDVRDGFRIVAERIAADIRAISIASSRARRGDIAIVSGVEHEALAVVDPSARRLATVSPRGLTFLPLSSGLAYWAVG